MRVATGLAMGSTADPELATKAVKQALRQLGVDTASSVLLLVTSEFANDPLPVIRAAAKAASTVQVIGCSAPGIFTEQEWVLDAPAVAVMVFAHGVALQPLMNNHPADLQLTLTAPNAINTNWLSAPGTRYGGVSGDALGQGPFSVWQNAKGEVSGHVDATIFGAEGVVKASHGLRTLSEPALISKVDDYQLLSIARKAALRSLNAATKVEGELPLHLLMVAFADAEETLLAGEYDLATIINTNDAEHSVTISRKLTVGQYMRWMIRDVEAAQQDFKSTIHQLTQQLDSTPEFGLLFSCMGRGPYFYSGVDRDLMLIQKQLPDMPLIGFYGNGEIAPINGKNQLLQYSAVLGLFGQ